MVRLFSRLQAIYGNRVTTMWGEADPNEVRRVWADELGLYAVEDLRAALDACRFAYKDYPPTLFQFSDLCRDAMRRRFQATTKIDYPKRGNAGIDSQILAEIHKITRRDRKSDMKDWARRILKRSEAGEHFPMIAINGAREALGLDA